MTQLILLNDDGSVKCRKSLPSIVDQSTIKGDGEGTKFKVDTAAVATALDGDGTRSNAGHIDADLVVDAPLSGAGRSDSHLKVATATADAVGVVELTGAAQIPAEANRDDDAITPAATKKLIGYIKPVATSGALNAAQLSADAIELPMFSNFDCTGGTNGAPRWTIHKEGGGTCNIDLGAYGGTTPPHQPGDVVFTGSLSNCLPLDAGVYEAENLLGASWIVVVLGGKISNALVPPPGGVGRMYTAVGAGSCVMWSNNSSNEPELTNIAIRGIAGASFSPISKITYLKAVGG